MPAATDWLGRSTSMNQSSCSGVSGSSANGRSSCRWIRAARPRLAGRPSRVSASLTQREMAHLVHRDREHLEGGGVHPPGGRVGVGGQLHRGGHRVVREEVLDAQRVLDGGEVVQLVEHLLAGQLLDIGWGRHAQRVVLPVVDHHRQGVPVGHQFSVVELLLATTHHGRRVGRRWDAGAVAALEVQVRELPVGAGDDVRFGRCPVEAPAVAEVVLPGGTQAAGQLAREVDVRVDDAVLVEVVGPVGHQDRGMHGADFVALHDAAPLLPEPVERAADRIGARELMPGTGPRSTAIVPGSRSCTRRQTSSPFSPVQVNVGAPASSWSTMVRPHSAHRYSGKSASRSPCSAPGPVGPTAASIARRDGGTRRRGRGRRKAVSRVRRLNSRPG